MNQLTVHSPRGSFKILSALVLVALVSLFANAQTGHSGRLAEQSGTQTYTESVVYTFSASPDAQNPVTGLIADSSGNLYGASEFSGAYGYGGVFELAPNGQGGWTYKSFIR